MVTILCFSVIFASPGLADDGFDYRNLHLVIVMESLPWAHSCFSLLRIWTDLGTTLALHSRVISGACPHADTLPLLSPNVFRLNKSWLIVILHFSFQFQNGFLLLQVILSFELPWNCYWATMLTFCKSFGFSFPPFLFFCDSDLTSSS